MSDEWMGRTTKHMALTHFVDFMVDAKDKNKYVAIKMKDTGLILYDGDERIKPLIEPAFKTIQEACFYDFGEDMAGCVDE